MKNVTTFFHAIKGLAIIMLLHFSITIYSQNTDSTKQLTHFAGSIGITNNGISVVPTFSFDKPAAIMLVSVGKNRLSFEPDIRFSLDAKRTGVALWWRYKILMNGKFRLNAGGHPAINIAIETDSAKESSKAVMVAQRFFGGEVVPYYLLSKNISVGVFYLYAHGLQEDGPRNVHFLTVNTNFSNIRISGQLYLQWIPQFYYLNIDTKDGVYFTSMATLVKNNFPFSLQSTINKTIKTNIPGKSFVWNVTLFYSFMGYFKK